MKYDNLTLHTDKYQINMMYAHWLQGTYKEKAVFEVYFRKLPFGEGYAVFAGLERVIHYMQNLHFGEEEIAYLRMQEENYQEEFLDALRAFTFRGDIQAIPEGTLVFPNVPLVRVVASIFEAQLVETAILNFVNFQTLIATKASRMKDVAPHDVLLEFGTRRAQEADAASGAQERPISRGSMRHRTSEPGCCSASRPKARTRTRGCRPTTRKRKPSVRMPRPCPSR